MMQCLRTAGFGTDSPAAHAASGSQTAGLVQASGAESMIPAAQRAINTPLHFISDDMHGAGQEFVAGENGGGPPPDVRKELQP